MQRIRPPLAALALLAIAAAGCLGSFPAPEPQAEPMGSNPAPASEEATPGRPIGFGVDSPPDLSRAPPFGLEGGSIPSRAQALEFANRYNSFTATTDAGFAELAANGHLTGRGTMQDPYVLERFYVKKDLSLKSLHGALIVREGYVEGTLRLNYVGEQVYVHHVYAGDLRVNENVERSAGNTGGLFHDNRFAFVGQIRHFVGEFRNNAVGPRPSGAIASYLGDSGIADVPEGVVFNFDGFHRALVHNNSFDGQVDIKLHGHNHGDCFTCPVHDHQDPAGFPDGASNPHDHGAYRSRHSLRYASLQFVDNAIIVDEGAALRFNDRNHAGDDQTANSEPNPFLRDPHVHYQDVTIARNHLQGSLRIDIFNAPDERHLEQNRGILRIWENDVTAPYATAGVAPHHGRVAAVDLASTDGLELSLIENTLVFQEQDDDAGGGLLPRLVEAPPQVGVLWRDASDGNATLARNTVPAGDFGVYAQDLSPTLWWTLDSNSFATKKAWQGERVSNPPEESP